MALKNKAMNVLTTSSKDLDTPVESGFFDMFHKNKLQCRIFYEDGSYADFFKKFGDSYVINIKKRKYVVIPSCIVKGKSPYIAWYFNNPIPITHAYVKSKITALDMTDKETRETLSEGHKKILADVNIDAESLNAVFNNRLIQGLYATGGLTFKAWLIIGIFAFIVILVILQLTGVVDIWGMVSGSVGG